MFNKKAREIKELKAYVKIKEYEIERLRNVGEQEFTRDEIISMFVGQFGVDVFEENYGYYHFRDSGLTCLIVTDQEHVIILENNDIFDVGAMFKEMLSL